MENEVPMPYLSIFPRSLPNPILVLSPGLRASRPHLLLPPIQTCSLDIFRSLYRFKRRYLHLVVSGFETWPPPLGTQRHFIFCKNIIKAFSGHRIPWRPLKSLQGGLSPTGMTNWLAEGGAVDGFGKLRLGMWVTGKLALEMCYLPMYICLLWKLRIVFFFWMEVVLFHWKSKCNFIDSQWDLRKGLDFKVPIYDRVNGNR